MPKADDYEENQARAEVKVSVTHLLDTLDLVGEPVAWCHASNPTCSDEPDKVDCEECLREFLDYAQRVRARFVALVSPGRKDGDQR